MQAFSFVTASDLENLAEALSLRPGDRLADLGCTTGGCGLWVARRSGARLEGVDMSSVAVKRASGRAGDFGVEARFRVGTFAEARGRGPRVRRLR